jgi:hypothetical protein
LRNFERNQGEHIAPGVDGVGASGILEGDLLTFGAVEEVYVCFGFLLGASGGDLHLVPAGLRSGSGIPERTEQGGVCVRGTVFLDYLSKP